MGTRGESKVVLTMIKSALGSRRPERDFRLSVITGMKYDEATWEFSDGEAGRGAPGEELSGRSARMLEKLTAKLARHHHDAEQLAATQHKRRKA